eukprot:scaffold503_cov375-Pinguiococcus_pyrenoidosus.AAC.5
MACIFCAASLRSAALCASILRRFASRFRFTACLAQDPRWIACNLVAAASWSIESFDSPSCSGALSDAGVSVSC